MSHRQKETVRIATGRFQRCGDHARFDTQSYVLKRVMLNFQLAGGLQYLCNACGLRFKKGKYCPICTKVYYDADTNPMTWIKCVNCPRWTHKVFLLYVQRTPHCQACRAKTDQSVQKDGHYRCVECFKKEESPNTSMEIDA